MKKIVAIMFTAVIALSFSTACKKQETSLSINGFESYDELRMVEFERCQARVRLTDDEKVVTDGKSALKFEITAPSVLSNNGWITSSLETDAYADNVTPTLVFAAQSGYNDLAELDAISFDVYNANDFESVMLFYAVDTNNSIVFGDAVRLNKECKTPAYFKFNRLFYGQPTKVKKYYIAFCGTFPATFYIDGLKAEKRTTAPASNSKTGTDKIMLTFDDAADFGKINNVYNTASPSTYACVNTDTAFVSGKYSLCITKLPIDGCEYYNSDAEEQKRKIGNGITLAADLLKTLNDGEKATVSFDAYVPAGKSEIVNVTIHLGEKLQTLSFNVASNKTNKITAVFNVSVKAITGLDITVSGDKKSGGQVFIDDLSIDNGKENV